MRTRRISAALLAVALTAGLAACGDDNDDADVAGGDGSGTPADSASLTTFCDAVVTLDAQPLPGGPGQQPDAATIKAAFAPMVEALETIESSAPETLALDVALLLDATQKAAETGEMMEVDAPNIIAAQGKLHAAVGTECGFQNVEITARDYTFAGIPSTLETGASYFELTNGGKEFHELVVVRKMATTTESFDQLLADPAQAFSKVDFLGVTFAAPGQTSGITADLTPGDYLAICFIPVEAEGENGSPHFLHGMKAEFTVS